MIERTDFLRLRVIGLGEWGARGAELFDRRGVPACVVHATTAVESSQIGEALLADGEADLFVVVVDLGAGAASPAASLLARIADIAPRAGRHVIARLPGLRSGPEERALGLVALNAVLRGPPAGIFLVQPLEARLLSDGDADSAAPLERLVDLWMLRSGAGGEPIQPLADTALERFFSTPGFLGWREAAIAFDDMAPRGRGWSEIVSISPWQPQGFAWGDAQAVLPLAWLPRPWLESGGRRQFERFVQKAWEETAPCELLPGLYVGEPTAVLVSAGMPYPSGLLALRDSVEADRERLAAKRRKAETPIPLEDDFRPVPGPAPDGRPRPREAQPEAESLETLATLATPELEPGPVPAVYESALALVRRIFSAEDLRSEVDLGEVRYVLYDLLEVVREEPRVIVAEVFRPALDEYFERHHVNVAVLAMLTGDILKNSLGEVINLGTAALLHDIGMFPTRETWDVGARLPPKVYDRIVRSHPDAGFRRLQELTGMTGTIGRIVLEEHERMDGSGYPEGLQGTSINTGARILAVCDTLEAMTHPRPYRDHLSPGEALTRLQTLGQYTLDSAVVQALTGELTGLLRRGAREPERR